MWAESQGNSRHASNAFEFTSIAEHRFYSACEQVPRNDHAPQVITCFGQGGGVVKACHEHDKVWRLAAKRIMQCARHFIRCGAGVVVLAGCRCGNAACLVAANSVCDHVVMVGDHSHLPYHPYPCQ
jgi:hypothetical protein